MERLRPVPGASSRRAVGEQAVSRPEGERYVFVGGCPRSGTTLLQNMLDSHPAIVGGPEFLHLVDIVQLRSKLLDSLQKGWIDLFVNEEEVDLYISELIDKLLLGLLSKHPARWLSEKSPENVLVMGELADLLPRAKFLYIVRDPRAIVASLLQVGKKALAKGEIPPEFTRDVASAISYTKRCLSAGERARLKHPDRIQTIRYEELVKDPEAVSRAICDYLGLDWAEKMLTPADQNHMGEAAITINSKELWYDKASYNANPKTNRLESWVDELKAHEQIRINRAFANQPLFSEYGYDFQRFQGSTLYKCWGYVVAAASAALLKSRKKLIQWLQ